MQRRVLDKLWRSFGVSIIMYLTSAMSFISTQTPHALPVYDEIKGYYTECVILEALIKTIYKRDVLYYAQSRMRFQNEFKKEKDIQPFLIEDSSSA
jgi:hypothetical protein